MSSKLYLVYYAVQKVVLTFEDISWGHTWTTDPAQGGSNFLSLCMKSGSATIQMKATEEYFPVVLLIMTYKVVATFESVDEV